MYKRETHNTEVREKLIANGMNCLDLADVMGVCQTTIYAWMRKEMTPERKLEVLEAIENACKE